MLTVYHSSTLLYTALGKKAWNKGTHTGIKPWLGKKRPEVTGENSKSWKGDKVGYTALHAWIRRQLGTPNVCEHCGTTDAKRYEWANISGQYKRNLFDWIRLCKRCHNN